MRTTLDLPNDLIREVMRLTNSKTKSEAIKKALQRVIDHEKRMKIIKYRGKLDLEIDLDVLRDRK